MIPGTVQECGLRILILEREIAELREIKNKQEVLMATVSKVELQTSHTNELLRDHIATTRGENRHHGSGEYRTRHDPVDRQKEDRLAVWNWLGIQFTDGIGKLIGILIVAFMFMLFYKVASVQVPGAPPVPNLQKP